MGQVGLTLPLWRIITGLGITQIIGWGTTYYALGALSEDIARSTGWSTTLIFGAFSAALLLGGVLSRRLGHAVDTRGGRRMMAAGSLLCAAGCGVLGIAQDPVTYTAGWLILGIAMRLATYDAAFASLAQITGGGARRAISYLSLFGGLSSTVFWPIGHLLSERIGWNGTFLVFALLHILICLPVHLTVLGKQVGASERALPDPVVTIRPLEGRERLIAMALFSAALAFNGFIFSAISAHVVPLFRGLGYDGAEAVTYAALIGPAQVASRFGEILMGKNLRATSIGLISLGLLPLSLAAFMLGGISMWGVLIFALLYGASNGLVTIVKGAVALSLFGPKGYGKVLGTLSVPSLALNAAAPLLFAAVLQHWGSIGGIAMVLAISLLSAFAMAALARLFPR
ncbi:MFS transporter [Aestuariivirga sp.]|uniref:MFS transporter n=1 Tax=Aestuariivirga sp. TaxID=2650926 RepID=UPI0039E359B8